MSGRARDTESYEDPCTDNPDLTEEEHEILFSELGTCPFCGVTKTTTVNPSKEGN